MEGAGASDSLADGFEACLFALGKFELGLQPAEQVDAVGFIELNGIIHQGEQHVKVMGLFGQALVSSNNPATV